MYRVEWTHSARDQLARLWVEVTDRNEITEAVNALDRELSARPLGLGESRTPPSRVVFRGPILVLFEVSEESKTVTVLGLKPVRRLP